MKKQQKPPQKLSINIETFAKRKEDGLRKYIINNLFEKIIYTTDDEIHKCLSEHLKHLEGRRSWITPLSILITIVTVFATSTFQSALGLSSYTWHTIFIVAGLVTCIWLTWSIIKAWKSKGVKSIIKDIVAELKKHSDGAKSL